MNNVIIKCNDNVINHINVHNYIKFIDKELYDFINSSNSESVICTIISILSIISRYFQSKWDNPERYIGMNVSDNKCNVNDNSNLLELVVIKHLPSIIVKFDSIISSSLSSSSSSLSLSSSSTIISMSSIFFFTRFINDTFKEMVNSDHIVEGISDINIINISIIFIIIIIINISIIIIIINNSNNNNNNNRL